MTHHLVASLAIAAALAVMLSLPPPASADAYCNQRQQAWNPCEEDDSDRPAQPADDASDDGGQRLPSAPCENLRLQVKADLGPLDCSASGLREFDAQAQVESIKVSHPGIVFLAEYVAAGHRTYIDRVSPTGLVGELGLKPTAADWGSTARLQGFDVRRFEYGVGGFVGLHCAAFTKHWGHVPQTPGYRHRIVGLYCDIRADRVADPDLDDFLAGIEPSS